MQFTPYLNFNGNCEEAFKFYEQVLGAKVESLFRHEGSPMEQHVPPEWRTKVMHSTLMLDGGAVMASDVPPGQYQKPNGFSVCVNCKDPADAERKFAALSKGGSVVMPIQQTFWAKRFGMLVDQFSIPWMINCE